ncbi:unnamed protein product, partial [marine sediment metagenome]
LFFLAVFTVTKDLDRKSIRHEVTFFSYLV